MSIQNLYFSIILIFSFTVFTPAQAKKKINNKFHRSMNKSIKNGVSAERQGYIVKPKKTRKPASSNLSGEGTSVYNSKVSKKRMQLDFIEGHLINSYRPTLVNDVIHNLDNSYPSGHLNW
jgi:hypothetical protein